MKRQRNTLISYLLFYGGFSLICIAVLLLVVYTVVMSNYYCNFIHLILLICIIIGIILPLFASDFNLLFYYSRYKPEYILQKAIRVNSETGFIQGVPNNKYCEYKVLEKISNGIITLESEAGLFIGNYNENKIIIDMNGWIFKQKYIYEYLHTMLRVNYINKNKKSIMYMYKTIKDSNIKGLIVVIKKNKKQKEYHISSDGIIKSPLGLRFKNYRKSRFINPNKKLSIKDFYDLNL